MRYSNIYANTQSKTFDGDLRDYMHLIYKYMGLSLFISAAVAFVVGTNQTLLRFFFSNMLMALIVQLSPLFFMFNLSKTIFTGSAEEARTKLFIFAGLMGISLSTIFAVYARQDITSAFLVSGSMFGGMSLYGYVTKKDLTGLGSFLMMGVMGLLFASLINIFFRSGAMSFGLSCISVLIFTLYTAYDVQNLKNLHSYASLSGGDMREKIAVMGALRLFMDFINIFTSVLHIMSRLNDRR
ncbi:MAG: Bax inhibitor-1/YccA family protein [Rickettsiales bacterium]|jgi:FtsH-binding integral membrane protein|nr:Bax inhibitor-1/YccA family protein [Rickettsiales bacterium]